MSMVAEPRYAIYDRKAEQWVALDKAFNTYPHRVLDVWWAWHWRTQQEAQRYITTMRSVSQDWEIRKITIQVGSVIR